MARKPLMLKEYLELDSSSESFPWSPVPQLANSVTVRCLLDTELRSDADSSPRSGSKGALRRLTAVIGAITFLQSPSADSPSATRAFSKRLRLRFWKRSGRQGREVKESTVLQLKDIERQTSFREEEVGWDSYPSLVVSSCSSSFDGSDSIGSDFLLSSSMFENVKHESPPPPSPRSDLSPTPSPSPTPQKEMLKSVDESSREAKENSVGAMNCPSEEEKEQFSPVAVMDFPYQDDDEDEEVLALPSPTSLRFPHNISNIDRTKNQLLQKIQRFESLSELHPVELDHRFARVEAQAESTFHVEVDEEDAGIEEEGERRRRSACALLRRLIVFEPFPACDEKLLFDFFVDELSLTQRRRGTKSGSAGDEELLRAASGWAHGGGGAERYDGEVVLGEMERSGGWRRCEELEEMAAVEMAGGLEAWLVEELLEDLVLSA